MCEWKKSSQNRQQNLRTNLNAKVYLHVTTCNILKNLLSDLEQKKSTQVTQKGCSWDLIKVYKHAKYNVCDHWYKWEQTETQRLTKIIISDLEQNKSRPGSQGKVPVKKISKSTPMQGIHSYKKIWPSDIDVLINRYLYFNTCLFKGSYVSCIVYHVICVTLVCKLVQCAFRQYFFTYNKYVGMAMICVLLCNLVLPH